MGSYGYRGPRGEARGGEFTSPFESLSLRTDPQGITKAASKGPLFCFRTLPNSEMTENGCHRWHR